MGWLARSRAALVREQSEYEHAERKYQEQVRAYRVAREEWDERREAAEATGTREDWNQIEEERPEYPSSSSIPTAPPKSLAGFLSGRARDTCWHALEKPGVLRVGLAFVGLAVMAAAALGGLWLLGSLLRLFGLRFGSPCAPLLEEC